MKDKALKSFLKKTKFYKMTRGLKKGQTNNPNGRPKGAPNKVTTDIREAFSELIANNIDKLDIWISEVAKKDPAKALTIIIDLSEFVIPKLARSDIDLKNSAKDENQIVFDPIDYSKLSDSCLREILAASKTMNV